MLVIYWISTIPIFPSDSYFFSSFLQSEYLLFFSPVKRLAKKAAALYASKSKHAKRGTDYIIFWIGASKNGIAWRFMSTVSYLLNDTLTVETVFTLRKQVYVLPVRGTVP